MGIGPYQARPYDNSRNAARLSDLAERQGEITATGHLRGGQIWGGAVERIGDIGGKMMSDLAEERETRPIRDAQVQTAKATLDAGKRKVEFNKALEEAGAIGDQDDALDFLRQRGFAAEASEMAKELAATRKTVLETTKLQMGNAAEGLSQAGIIMGTVKDNPDPAGAYAKVRPQLESLLGPDMSKMLPGAYDPAFVDKALTWGQSQKDKLTAQKLALEIEDQTGKPKRERDEYFTKSLSALLSTVDSQDDWDLFTQGATALGAPAETVAKFGTTFSPEALARAKALSVPARADNPTSEEQDMDAYAKSLGLKSGSELSFPQRQEVRRKRTESGTRPPRVTASSLDSKTKITPQEYQKLLKDIEQDYNDQLVPEADEEQPSVAQRGAAIRWRSGAMRQLDALARKSGVNPGSLSDLAGEAQPEGWRAPMAPGREKITPVASRPSAPPVNFRQPSEAPSSSSQPVGLNIPGRGMQYFPNTAARDAFLRDMGWSLK